MSSDDMRFTDAEFDYIREIMNIGAGNAAGALAQVLGKDVDLSVTNIQVIASSMAPDVIFPSSSQSVTLVEMKLVGDVRGGIYFAASGDDAEELQNLAESQHHLDPSRKGDITTLNEIANVLTGAYLTAIHDFCRLNMFHSVGEAVSYLRRDELAAAFSEHGEDQNILMVENTFSVRGTDRARDSINYFISIVGSASVAALKNSLQTAMAALKDRSAREERSG